MASVKVPDRAAVVRAVTLPIREVVSERGLSVLDTFRPLWGRATRLANWAQRQLVTRDALRTAAMERLPAYDRTAVFGTVPRQFARKGRGEPGDDGHRPAAKVGDPQEGSLYRLFCDEYPDRPGWDGCAVSARDVLKAVEDAWRNHPRYGRYAVMWRGEARPCVFGYPYPWPVPADKGKTLRIMRAEPDRPMASIPAPDEAEDRILLRLADGREFRRQLRQFDALLADPARMKQGRVKGVRRGGRLVGAALVLVGSFDRAEAGGDRAAECRTGRGGLLRVATADGREFAYHGDELPGIVALYDDWRHRFAVDQKHEKRWPAAKRARRLAGPRVRAKQEAAANRLRTARLTAAAQVAGWLARNGVSELRYDDSDKSFLPRFDWTGLREVLRCKCQEAGISFHHVARVDDVTN